MARGRFSAAHTVVMAVVPLAAALDAGLITFTFAGEIASAGSQVSSALSVDETVTATYTFASAAAPTAISSTQGVYGAALTSFNVTTSGRYTASATEGQIAINNDDLDHHDRYRAVIAESSALFDLSAPDVNGIALDGFVDSEFDPTNTAFGEATLSVNLRLSNLDPTDSRTIMQLAFDFGSSPNIEAFLVAARSLSPEQDSPEQEMMSGFEPRSIVLFLVGVIGSAVTCLALGRRALTERKRTGGRSKDMPTQAGKVRRIRRAFVHRHSGTWLAAFLSLLAFIYFLFFALP